MNTFYTVTSEHTHRTNSTSTRYHTLEQAQREASERLSRDGLIKGVYVLRAIEFHTRAPQPTQVIPLE